MKLLLHKILWFLMPFMIPVILYFIIDPFKVLYEYSELINTKDDYQTPWNRDFQSTQLFLANYDKYNYDSFIFGNSRSFFFQTKTWNQFVKGSCFHFNASSESLYGLNCKFMLINDLDVNIKNALILLDENLLSEIKNIKGHLFIKHPALSKQFLPIFHLEMFKGFFPKSILAYIDIMLTRKRKKYMGAFGIRENVWKHDMVTNQLTYYIYDQQLLKNQDQYYRDKMKLFYARDTTEKYSEPSIKNEQKVLLENIHSILKQHNTNYKIAISPLYNQKKLNQNDLNYLKQLFGIENVYDFSGINAFTNDYQNYYERQHFRPTVCDSIIKLIYKK